MEAEHSSVLPMTKPEVGQCSYIASDERLQLHSGHPLNSSSRNQALTTSVTKSVDGDACSSDQLFLCLVCFHICSCYI